MEKMKAILFFIVNSCEKYRGFFKCKASSVNPCGEIVSSFHHEL